MNSCKNKLGNNKKQTKKKVSANNWTQRHHRNEPRLLLLRAILRAANRCQFWRDVLTADAMRWGSVTQTAKPLPHI